jgi:hypothetical protein
VLHYATSDHAVRAGAGALFVAVGVLRRALCRGLGASKKRAPSNAGNFITLDSDKEQEEAWTEEVDGRFRFYLFYF